MKYIFILFFIFSALACKQEAERYVTIIVDDKNINIGNLQNLNEAEKALICIYLFTYANACPQSSTSIKCQILNNFNIDNECDSKHISFLKKWFPEDHLLRFKLNNCPVLPINYAIQNKIEKIVLIRSKDSLSILFKVNGMNELQEKSWNKEVTDTYTIHKNTLIKTQNNNKYDQ